MNETLDALDNREDYQEVDFGPKTFTVPEDWSIERFGDVFTRRSESIDVDERETVRYVGLKHINSGELEIADYDEDGQERSSSRAFKKGDILFGKLRPNLEKAAVATFDGVCSSDIIPIYADDDLLRSYLPYLMHSKLVRDRMVATMEGTNLPRTSWDDLASMLIPIPPENERRRIVQILSTVNTQIQQTKQYLEIYGDLRVGVLRDILSGEVNNKETKTVHIGPVKYEMPEHWEIRTIEELLANEKKAIRGGPAGGRIKKEDRVDSGYKLYFQENIIKSDFDYRDDYITKEKFSELSDMEPIPGDILVTLTGNVGECAVFPDDAERGIYESNVMRIRVNQEECLPEYLCELLDNSKVVDDQILAMSHGGTRKKLNNKIVKSISVPVPPKEEQNHIMDILSTLDFHESLNEPVAFRVDKDTARA